MHEALADLWNYLQDAGYQFQAQSEGSYWTMLLEPLAVTSAFLALSLISGLTYLSTLLIRLATQGNMSTITLFGWKPMITYPPTFRTFI
jgi:hypothetical protein